MRKIVTDEQIMAIIKANETVCGTVDYRKYYMCCEYKHKEIDNTWSAWKYVAWTIPYGISKFVKYYWKTVRGKLYIMTECEYMGEIERYEVTPAVKELLGI